MIAVPSRASSFAGDACTLNACYLATVHILSRVEPRGAEKAPRSSRRSRRCRQRHEHREQRKTRSIHARLALRGGETDLQAIASLPPRAFTSRAQHVRRFAAVGRGQSSFMSHLRCLSFVDAPNEEARCASFPRTGPCKGWRRVVSDRLPPRGHRNPSSLRRRGRCRSRCASTADAHGSSQVLRGPMLLLAHAPLPSFAKETSRNPATRTRAGTCPHGRRMLRRGFRPCRHPAVTRRNAFRSGSAKPGRRRDAGGPSTCRSFRIASAMRRRPKSSGALAAWRVEVS